MPSASMDWELSWSRTLRWMRFRDPEGSGAWYCKQIAGHSRLVSVDSAQGRINLRCRCQLQGDQVSLYYPKEGPYPMDPESIKGIRLPHSHWRLCYYRQGLMWRLFDERRRQLTLVKGYTGNICLNWLDTMPHVFHDGYVILDPEGIAHFIDPAVEVHP